MSADGGDPACWLEQVCDHCGSVIEDDRPHRCRLPVSDAVAAGPPPTDGQRSRRS